MKQKHSYGECYRILNTKSGCSWNELRKTYKIQIQKWHPDRFEEGTNKKAAAEEKIKDLNSTYRQLSQYYKEYGYLPEIEEKQKLKPSSIEQKQTNTSKTNKPKTETPQKEERKIPFFLTIITISVFIYALIKLTPSELEITESQATYFKTTPINSANEAETSKGVEKETTRKTNGFLPAKNRRLKEKNDTESFTHNKNEDFFTYGSNIGDVISIQGPPTKTDGDTWFYGESEVHFHNGTVIRWKRAYGYPLKAGLVLSKDKKDESSIKKNKP